MLCERIKGKIPSHHKGTPRQHSLKQILVAVRLLILSLFPCNKDSENLLQKNMLEICGYWITIRSTKKSRKRKPIYFKGVGYHFPKLPPIFWLFSSTPVQQQDHGLMLRDLVRHDFICHQAWP